MSVKVHVKDEAGEEAWLAPGSGMRYLQVDLSQSASLRDSLDKTDLRGPVTGWMKTDKPYALVRRLHDRLILAVDTTVRAVPPANRLLSSPFRVLPGTERNVEGAAGLLEGKKERPPSRGEWFLASDASSVPSGIEIILSPDTTVEVRTGTIAVHGPAAHGHPVECVLVLDLGNTRTVGVLVDLLENAGGVPTQQMISALRLRFRDNPLERDDPAADSRVEFVGPATTFPVRTFNAEWRESFFSKGAWRKIKEFDCDPALFPRASVLSLGADAARAALGVDWGMGLASGLSSPKKYYWSDRPQSPETPWFRWASGKPAHLAAPVLRFFDPSGRTFDPQGKEFSDTPGALALYPDRDVLVMAFLEIIEQAASYCASASYLRGTARPLLPRKLSQVAITYPSNWGPQAQERYLELARRAVAIFAQTHPGAPEISVRLIADEATAVQICYVYSEIQKYGAEGDLFFETFGRKNKGQRTHSARVASIDIGGGTTDLAILDLTDALPGPGVRLKCKRLYSDGSQAAGDAVAKALLERHILPQFAEANHLGLGDRKAAESLLQEALFAEGGAGQEAAKIIAARKALVTRFWRPLADRWMALACLKKSEEDVDLNDFAEGRDRFQALLQGLAPGAGVLLPSKLRYRREHFTDILQDVFGDVFERFSAAVTAFDCDLVVLGGRPSNIPAIQEMLHEVLPLPPRAFIPLGGHRTGAWYPFRKAREDSYRIDDPKTTVAVGGAISILAEQPGGLEGVFTIITEQSRDLFGRWWWGLVAEKPGHPKPTFQDKLAIFRPDLEDARAEVPWSAGHRVHLCRRRVAGNSTDVEPVYLLQTVKPGPSEPAWQFGEDFVACLERSTHESGDEVLRLYAVKGHLVRNHHGTTERIAADSGPDPKVELALCGLMSQRTWLDTGVLRPSFTKPE